MKYRRRASSLRAQIFIRTLVVGLVPLALLAVVAVLGLRTLEQTADRGVATSRQSLASSTVTARLRSESEAAGREIDLVLAERINDVVTWSRQPSVIEGAEAAAQLAGANGLIGLDAEAAEARFAGSPSLGAAPLADAFLAAEMERRGQFVDISFTDRNGFNAGVVGTAQDFVQSDEAWWQSAWDNGIYVGGVTLHPESNQYVIPISSRVENAGGTRVGVLRASLSLAFVQSVADAHTDDDVNLVVVTAAKQLLAETVTGHDPARIGSTELTDADFSNGVLAAIESSDGALIGDDAVFGFTRVESTRGAVERDDQVDRFDWFIISSQPTSTAFAPLAGLEELNEDLSQAGRRLSLITLLVLLLSCVVAAAAAAVLSRKLVRPIKMLTERARRAAEQDLPSAVARMQDDNYELGTTDETTIEISAGNELHELASSFNSVQRTAIRLAAEQARQRKTTAEMFANLGRRNQSLVKRQLRFIEKLEHSEEDPDRLSSLFRLDHLATRMRRNAESLLVIAGHRSANRRSTPVRIELMAQAALGEVENFERVNASSIEPAALVGRTVSDVAHVLAELIENALSFSPPEAPVAVTGKSGPTHYTLSVIDRGIGLSADELVGINARLSVDADIDLRSSRQLGLLVVSKLAARHSLEVRLVGTNAGGISAEVKIPNGLIQAASDAPALPTQARASTDVGQAGITAPAALSPPTTATAPTITPTGPTAPTITPTGPMAASAGGTARQETAAPVPASDTEFTPSGASVLGDSILGDSASDGLNATAPESAVELPGPTDHSDRAELSDPAELSDHAVDGLTTSETTGFDADQPTWQPSAETAALRRKDDLSPSVADNIFRAPGIAPDQVVQSQASDDPEKQRRVSDAGFAFVPADQGDDNPPDHRVADLDAPTETPALALAPADVDVDVDVDVGGGEDDSAGGDGRYIGSLSSKSVAQISSVKRRESRRPEAGATRETGPRPKRSVAITNSVEEVSQEAEKLRDRWSSFQRGRRKASPGIDGVGQEHDDKQTS